MHPDLAKKVEVCFYAENDRSLVSDVTFEHFAGVTSLDVESIAYEGGTTWHAKFDQPCTVYPDLLLPAGAR